MITRREILKGMAGAGIAAIGGCKSEGAKSDLVRDENGKPGTTDWMLTNTRVDPKTKYRCPWIEGYCSRTSVRAGETIEIKVSTNPRVELHDRLLSTGLLRRQRRPAPGAARPVSRARRSPIRQMGEERLRECAGTRRPN